MLKAAPVYPCYAVFRLIMRLLLVHYGASSKTCRCCGYKMEEMPLSVPKWDCPNCQEKVIDRDISYAINIHSQGGRAVCLC
jgi:transposase